MFFFTGSPACRVQWVERCFYQVSNFLLVGLKAEMWIGHVDRDPGVTNN